MPPVGELLVRIIKDLHGCVNKSGSNFLHFVSEGAPVHPLADRMSKAHDCPADTNLPKGLSLPLVYLHLPVSEACQVYRLLVCYTL